MELLQMTWLVIVVSLLVGAAIGILCYRMFSSSVKQAGQVKAELEAAKEEMETYKASVNQHFEKTSELVGDLTQSYVKVYQHLAEGSEALGVNKTFTNLLEQHQRDAAVEVVEEPEATDPVGVDEATNPEELIVDEPTAPEDIVVDTLPREDSQDVDEHAEPFVDPNAAVVNTERSNEEAASSLASEPETRADDLETTAETVDIDVGTVGDESKGEDSHAKEKKAQSE